MHKLNTRTRTDKKAKQPTRQTTHDDSRHRIRIRAENPLDNNNKNNKPEIQISIINFPCLRTHARRLTNTNVNIYVFCLMQVAFYILDTFL